MQIIKNTLLVLFSCAFFLTVWIVGTILILALLFGESTPQEETGYNTAYNVLIGDSTYGTEKSFWDLSLKELGMLFLTKEFYISHEFWHGVAGIVILVLSFKLIRRNKALAIRHYNPPPVYDDDHNEETFKWLGLGALFAFMIFRVFAGAFVGALCCSNQEVNRNQLNC